MLVGAAFPFMLQLVLSASVILFADINDDAAIQGFSLAVGELMLIGAYVIFGRQNGISAYRKFTVSEKKRELQTDDIAAYYRTGEYAVWKGIVIGVISVIPFIIFEFIECVAPNTVCGFVLKYAFGWAVYPFIVFGVKIEWLNFIWIIIPVVVHTAAYIWGAVKERKKQQLVREAQEIKKKK